MKRKIGIITLVIGILHITLGLVKFSSVFKEMVSEGFFNTAAGEPRGWALWFTSTGVVFVLLGLAFKYIENKNHNIPSNIGWILFIFSILGGIALPLSGFWALLLPAILILIKKKKA